MSLSIVTCEPHFAASDQAERIAMQDQGTKAALLVDAKEASRMLAVSSRKLCAMTFEDRPGLPYIRCGRLVRYPVDNLRQWVDAQRQGVAHAK